MFISPLPSTVAVIRRIFFPPFFIISLLAISHLYHHIFLPCRHFGTFILYTQVPALSRASRNKQHACSTSLLSFGYIWLILRLFLGLNLRFPFFQPRWFGRLPQLFLYCDRPVEGRYKSFRRGVHLRYSEFAPYCLMWRTYSAKGQMRDFSLTERERGQPGVP